MMEENFGKILRQYRKEHYLTQKQMADLIGLSPNHIGTLESGKKKPRASTIAAFEEAVKQKSWKTWYPSEELGNMREDERKAYEQIWKGLRRLDSEREKEVLEMFFRILDWL